MGTVDWRSIYHEEPELPAIVLKHFIPTISCFSANDDSSEPFMKINISSSLHLVICSPRAFRTYCSWNGIAANLEVTNIAIGPLIQTWRIGSDAKPPRLKKFSALQIINPNAIVLSGGKSKSVFSKKGMKIDLVPWQRDSMADRIADLLKAWEKVTSALITLR